MRDLLKDPAWRECDLGHSIPDSPYAVSVALPHWQHVIDYEECVPQLLAKLRAGYPRFFPPHSVRELAESVAKDLRLGQEQKCSVYPNRNSAERCAEYVRERADGWDVEVQPCAENRAMAVVYPRQITAIADDYWRYAGEGVSGRQAAELSGALEAADEGQAGDARAEVRQRIAGNTGQSVDDVLLFPSGMAAVAAVQRAVTTLAPARQTVQFDFPYVDVLRVQREMGSGVSFLPAADDASVEKLSKSFERGERPAAVYCEVPSNPLLRCADLQALHRLTAPSGVPLIVDDTVATHLNVDAFRYADLVTTSLTKSFSGSGDVMAGAVIVNHQSPLASQLKAALVPQVDLQIGGADAVALAKNSRDFDSRMQRVNETAPQLVEFLGNHDAVDSIYYPTVQTRDAYDRIRKSGGGYSGLLSVVLKDPSRRSPTFYDALRMSKGPSLGANFSLACPYTLLAHYQELDWCIEMGVSPWLVRISVGLEPFDELKVRLEIALAKSAS